MKATTIIKNRIPPTISLKIGIALINSTVPANIKYRIKSAAQTHRKLKIKIIMGLTHKLHS